MLRHTIPVRRDLDRIADEHGFDFHVIDNEIYWDESRAYRFTLRQIEEQIEKPTAELHQMCLEAVDRAVKDEQLLQQLFVLHRYTGMRLLKAGARGILLSMAVWILYGAVPTLRLSCWNIMRIRQRHFTKLPGFNGFGWKTPDAAG